MAITTWSANTILNVAWVRNVSGIHRLKITRISAEQVQHAAPCRGRGEVRRRLGDGRGARHGRGHGGAPCPVARRRRRRPSTSAAPSGSSCFSSIRCWSDVGAASSAITTSAPQHDHPRASRAQLVAVGRAHDDRARRCAAAGRRGGGCRPWSRRRRPGSARRARAPWLDAQPAGHHDLLLRSRPTARRDQLLRLGRAHVELADPACWSRCRSARRRAGRRDQNVDRSAMVMFSRTVRRGTGRASARSAGTQHRPASIAARGVAGGTIAPSTATCRRAAGVRPAARRPPRGPTR